MSWAGRRRRVCLTSLLEFIADDALALDVLADVLDGHVTVPRGQCADLFDLI